MLLLIGPDEYGEIKAIARHWHSVDGAITKHYWQPDALVSTGSGGDKGETQPVGPKSGPLSFDISGASTHDAKLLEGTLN